MPTTFDVTIGHVILKDKKVLYSRALILKNEEAIVWKDHVCNCAPCYLPHIDGIINPNLAIMHVSFKCMLCWSTSGVTTILLV